MAKLNIPKNVNVSKFDSVDFVENMSMFQLKTLVKNMWENMGDLANAMDNNGRSDVSNAIDNMREGNAWSEKKFRNSNRYILHGYTIIMYDSKGDTFSLLDDSGNRVDYDAMNQKELTAHVKTIIKRK